MATRGPSCRLVKALSWLVVCVTMPVFVLVAQETERPAGADWPTYNRDLAGTRFSPLDQINTRTVRDLEEVWSFRFHPEDGFIEGRVRRSCFSR